MGDFKSTHWSLVQKAGHGTAETAAQALEHLCRLYWYPIYAYSRRLNDSHQEAEDLTQSFFAELLEKNLVAKARPEKGRFRSFLLSSFQRHRSKHRRRMTAQKRGGQAKVLSLEELHAEERFTCEPRDTALTPDEHFERHWALTVLDQAHQRLADEYARAGKQRVFTCLAVLLQSFHEASSYAAKALELGKTEAAVKMEAYRMRNRLGALLHAVVRETVSDATECEAELRFVRQVLSR